MSLQARLRHALGERWIDLPERGVELPLVVGRAGTADVQVPSAAVGQRHCVLFVHEGQWAVQDLVGGGAATFVNGTQVNGAAFLRVGDVITLGPEATAPSIEVDPVAAMQGRAGHPALAAITEVPPAAPGYLPPAALEPNPYGQNIPADRATFSVPAPASAPWQQAASPTVSGDEGPTIDWPSGSTRRYVSPRRRKTSDGSTGVIVGMMLTLLIAGATGYWLYRQSAKPTIVQAPTNPATQPGPTAPSPRIKEDTNAPRSIFGNSVPGTRSASQPATRPDAVGEMAARATAPEPQPMDSSDVSPREDSAPEAVPTGGTSGEDPAVATAGVDDLDWKQVEMARYLKDEAKAILQFDDYARMRPGTASDKIAAYTETMIDRIWFERIENLCEQREDLNKKIAEVDKEMAEETDAAYKKRVLVPLRQQYHSRLQSVGEELKNNMKYDRKDPPNLLDDTDIDKLRKARDPQYYGSWKSRVLAHIRRTHGELPWAAAKNR